MSTLLDQDTFYQSHFASRPLAPEIPFSLQKGDVLALIGDSITEAPRWSHMVEAYLAMCRPDLEVEVRNFGKGGETAEGFLARMEQECLIDPFTAAIVSYGMNDSQYINSNRKGAESYGAALEQIVGRLLERGIRVIVCSPTCIGRLPWWPFVSELGGTLEGLNDSLRLIRDQAAAVAAQAGVTLIDHFWNTYRLRLQALERFGPDFALCGGDDGVHPSWAGHATMAWTILKTLGMTPLRGELTLDLIKQSATTSQGHRFVSVKDGAFRFTSSHYPFCWEGPPGKDWSMAAGFELVSFHDDLNVFRLRVLGLSEGTYRVSWMNEFTMLEEWHDYSASQLSIGINLAAEFPLNPFVRQFRRVFDQIVLKQAKESQETWKAWTLPDSGVTSLEAVRSDRQAYFYESQRLFEPVTHTLRVHAQP